MLGSDLLLKYTFSISCCLLNETSNFVIVDQHTNFKIEKKIYVYTEYFRRILMSNYCFNKFLNTKNVSVIIPMKTAKWCQIYLFSNHTLKKKTGLLCFNIHHICCRFYNVFCWLNSQYASIINYIVIFTIHFLEWARIAWIYSCLTYIHYYHYYIRVKISNDLCMCSHKLYWFYPIHVVILTFSFQTLKTH